MKFVIGQRWASESQPELGLGVVIRASDGRVTVMFPATGETLTYAEGTAPLKRVVFTLGDKLATQNGEEFVVETVREVKDLYLYGGDGMEVHETMVDDRSAYKNPDGQLLAGEFDEKLVFDLRFRAYRALCDYRKKRSRGLIGARMDLIPHQLFIADSVSRRFAPRVLLADEVGLGKTIEACLILHRLILTGRAARVLILTPESLIHQWFVELLRRFQLQFSIYDEDRCRAIEGAPEGGNPFLESQWILASTNWLATSGNRVEQAIEAGFDMVIVDEAHHLEWNETAANAEYVAVEKLAAVVPGLLLLTATPEQLGREGHFARLRLLDPNRFDSLEAYIEERSKYNEVSDIAGKLEDREELTDADKAKIDELLGRGAHRLDAPLALAQILDFHGTGRVMFRNLRKNLGGFPERKLVIKMLPKGGNAETKKMKWLAKFVAEDDKRKVLVICHTREKAEALYEAAREAVHAKAAVFHEGLTLIQRDRNAAWFSEEEGARLLICSEIGSEGRNFQFAHHLVLFDLPTEPGLLEQRIGRLDRIGQTETINIHVPCLKASDEEGWLRWYHEGLNAFEQSLHGGAAVMREFGERLGKDDWDKLIEETKVFKGSLTERLESGRDRLLELSSFERRIAWDLVDRLRRVDEDPLLEKLSIEMFDFFGVAVEPLSDGLYSLRPDSAFSAECLPGLKEDGMTVTYRRKDALTREDYTFMTWDNPMIDAGLSEITNSARGVTSFVRIAGEATPTIMIEAVYVLEALAPKHLHADRFLAATPLRSILNHRGREMDREEYIELLKDAVDGEPQWLRDRADMLKEVIRPMMERAERNVERRTTKMRDGAIERMRGTMEEEIGRLLQLKRLGHSVRDQEINAAATEMKELEKVLQGARVRMDALRIVLVGG
jgi:ATP-dependent helicase HepA